MLGGVSPPGETLVPFCLSKKEPKRHQGVWLRRTPRQRRVFIVATPGPHLRERVTLAGQFVPAGKIKICFRSTPRPQGLSAIKICKLLLLLHAAWCLRTCWVRRVSFQRPQQLPSCHSSARVGGVISTQMTQNFRLCRPQWAGARRAVRPGFARRIKLPIL